MVGSVSVRGGKRGGVQVINGFEKDCYTIYPTHISYKTHTHTRAWIKCVSYINKYIKKIYIASRAKENLSDSFFLI